MEIIVKVNEYDDIYKLNNANSYLLANKNVSYRYTHSFTINEIKQVKAFCKKENKKVYILINKIFKDKDLINLELFIEKMINISVDGIFFTDFAVFMLAKKHDFADKCFFYHETFLRNSYDIQTYQKLGIKNIICSKDMNIEDISNLPKENKEQYGIICFGYIPLYESERQVVTNFLKQNDLPIDLNKSTDLFLKEATRKDKYRILQQNGIASIFDGKVLSYLPYMQKLNENIDKFIIDCLFFDVEYIYNVIDIFKKSIDCNFDNNILTNNDSIQLTTGFLNKRVGLK